MTANTDTTDGRNNRNDTTNTHSDRNHTSSGDTASDTTTPDSTNHSRHTSDNRDRTGNNISGEGLADLTPKQQAILIASLEHPDDPAVKIATRVQTAQSYPSQIITKYSNILDELRHALSTGDSVVDVVERELSKQAITTLVEHGLLDGVDTELAEMYCSDDIETSMSRQNGAINERDRPVDRPVTVQRSFMSASPGDEPQNSHSGVGDRLHDPTTHETDSKQTALADAPMDTEANLRDTGVEGDADITGEHWADDENTPNDEVVREWYNALTKKQRAIVDAITQHPDATDTRRAEIASNQLPNGESVSRAYVSKTKADDAPFLEALRTKRELECRSKKPRDSASGESRNEPAVGDETNVGTDSNPNYEPNSGANDQDVTTVGETRTADEAHEQNCSNIPVKEVKRIRDRIAFSASVIEREYHLTRTTADRDNGVSELSGAHASGTVAFARQTLAEINKLLEHSR